MPDGMGSLHEGLRGSALFGGRFSIEEALAQLRLKLLDLTARNRLLNFRHSTTRSIQVVDVVPTAVFDRLTDAKPIRFLPVPDPDPSEYVGSPRKQKPEVRDYAAKLGISTSYTLPRSGAGLPARGNEGSTLRVLSYPEDLDRQCRYIAKEARSAIEETGTNMLYLVFGFLEWYESDDSDKPLFAPLIAVPIALKKGAIDPETRFAVYDLAHTGDEIAENLSLREKLRKDFSVNIPEFDEEKGPEDYFERLAEVVRKRNRWKIRRQISLAMLSFAKLLIVRDLDPNNWPTKKEKSALVENDLVRSVFGEISSGGDAGANLDDHDIDDHPQANLSLIYDADTSQHSALIDALEGQNLVIDGPPGTGKSQTITNLIAESLVRGKRVLFVSEKLAALEVVKNRLETAGLADFCLELHSHKTSKKAVVDSLAMRRQARYPAPPGFEGKLELLELRRKALKQYADLMNSRVGNALELSVFQVLWRAERHRQETGANAEAVKDLLVPTAISTTNATLVLMEAAISALASHFSAAGGYATTHPWYGYFPTTLSPGDDLQIEAALRALMSDAERIKANAASLRKTSTDASLDISMEGAAALSRALSTLPEPGERVRCELLDRFFPIEDMNGVEAGAALTALAEKLNRYQVLVSETGSRLLSGVTISEEVIARAQALLGALRRHGCHDFRLKDIAERIERLREIANGCQQSLGALAPLNAVLGLPDFGSEQAFTRALAILEACHDAPRDLLEYRMASFANPSARELALRASRELIRLRGQQKALDAIFFLEEIHDWLPLQEALETFREGDAWYRVLQGRWRRVRRLYRKIAREKSKRASVECAENLHALVTLRRDRERFNANEEYKHSFGRLFKGEATELEKLNSLLGWYERSQVKLEAASVSPAEFNLTATEAFRISELAGRRAMCKSHIDALHEASKELVTLTSGSPYQADITNASADWRARLASLERLTAELAEAVEFFEVIGHQTVSAHDVEEALRGLQAAMTLGADIEGDERLQKLLGAQFAGLMTDMAAVGVTLEWGRRISNSGLPGSLKRRLLTTEALSLLPKLRTEAEALEKSWAAVGSFTARMRALGEFDWARWMPGGEEGIVVPEAIASRAERSLDALQGLLSWSQYNHARKELERQNLLAFAERLEAGSVTAESLASAFRYRFYGSIAQSLFRSNPLLAKFSGTTQAQLREEFAALDREIIALRGKDCAARIARATKPPRGVASMVVGEKSEMELLRHLMSLQKPKTPIRQMIKRAGEAIQALKPCFMMGPLSVAQYLEPAAVEFDVVIMDEASQLRPEEALGSVARGKQLVVVGDPKQLPPTSFFDRMTSTEDDPEDSAKAAAADSESILDICLPLFPTRTLKWHYRSQHESLIAFSNANFYDGRLIVFPTPYPRTRQLGLQYFYVKGGEYQNRQNFPEASRIVEAIVEHMSQRPGESLGVVTLNITQRDLIEELLEKRLRDFQAGETYRDRWEQKGWPFFVKNLENVQGDERDVILISTTFGPPPGGQVVRQNFGPVSREMGWRRLNVLFTRARRSMHIYSSMRPGDITVDGNTKRGTAALQGYLEYAANGNLVSPIYTDREPDSDFEVAVANVLRNKGFEVVPQLGVAGFFIDIAVRNPDRRGEFLAAIECDGATYHSGVSVRDRDRIRQQILEGLGWKGKIHRIWSTDWFRDPHREIGKLVSFLNARCEASATELSAVREPTSDYDSVQGGVPKALAESAQQIVSMMSEEEELFVEVGDSVTFTYMDRPDERNRIQIVGTATNLDQGLINEGMPLARALLGATEGEEVELQVPAKPKRILKVLKVERVGEQVPA